MTVTRYTLGLVTIGLLAACGGGGGGGDDDGGGATDPDPTPAESFEASLNVQNMVVPNVVSEGTGTAAFTLDDGTLTYTIDVTNIDNVTAAHIHGPATVDQGASIILDLFVPSTAVTVNGRLAQGSVAEGTSQLRADYTLADVLDLMRSGNAFVMVHSSEYPGGEIRGQVEEL